MTSNSHRERALRDFDQARTEAAFADVLARLSGRSNELLSFDDIRVRFKGTQEATEKLQEIPVKLFLVHNLTAPSTSTAVGPVVAVARLHQGKQARCIPAPAPHGLDLRVQAIHQ